MKLYIKRQKSNIDSICEFNPVTKRYVVLANSKVSETIAHSEKFRGSNSIEKSRSNTVKNGIVLVDVEFKSASTAANFVCGSSTNGLTAWKDATGKNLKTLLAEMGENDE